LTRKALLMLAVGVVLLAATSAAAAQERHKDYFAPEVLDKPLGVELLSNGNVLITDGGGAYYTTTDASIMEVDPAGQIVWQYAGEMAFPHSAERLATGETLISDTSNDRVFMISQAGDVTWTSDDWRGGSGELSDGSHLQYPNDAELLENGHLLITDRNNDRVVEVDLAGEVVWSYSRLTRPHNGDRLSNGDTLIANSEENQVVEVSAAGEIVWSYGQGDVLDWPRDADRLADGNTLITDTRHGRVIEVNPAGEVVWTFEGLALPYEADRLADGTTLISDNSHHRVIRVTPGGEIAWEFTNFQESLPTEVQNPGFETDGDGDGLPDGWYPADLNAEGDALFLWDSTVVKEGKHSAGGQYSGDGRMSWLQSIAVVPGVPYEFSGYVKAQILKGVVAYQLQFVDGIGGPLGDVISVAAHDASTDWVRDAAEVQAPVGAAGVQIWCQIIADGRAWFDGVQWQEKGSRGAVPVWAIGALAGAVLLGGALVLLLRRRRAGRA
jgi:hypothetical protein